MNVHSNIEQKSITSKRHESNQGHRTSVLVMFIVICRLDFLEFEIALPPSGSTVNPDIDGDCTESGDTFTVMSPTGVNPPLVCGILSGQHSMYFNFIAHIHLLLINKVMIPSVL